MSEEKGVLRVKRRSNFEMKVDVLRAIADGKKRILHIMYASNINHACLRGILNFLREQGLVETHGKNFHLTTKGQATLESAQRLLALMEEVDAP